MKRHCDINWLMNFFSPENINYLQKDEKGEPYAYVEVGEFKPYHGSIVRAAMRRGCRVKEVCPQVYYVYAPSTTNNLQG